MVELSLDFAGFRGVGLSRKTRRPPKPDDPVESPAVPAVGFSVSGPIQALHTFHVKTNRRVFCCEVQYISPLLIQTFRARADQRDRAFLLETMG